MDKNPYELLFELLKSNKYEDLFIQCLELLFKKINSIFSFKNKYLNNTSKLQENRKLSHIFEKLARIFEDSTHIEIITKIKNNLMRTTNFCEIEELFQISINNVLNYFNEIYKIYGFITVCCLELKNTKILIYYLTLSHNILPCFIIGDLLFLKKNMAGNWNTEKVLISSIAKVSKEIYQDKDSKFLSKRMEELYFSWIICLDNWLEYLKTRLFIINNFQRNFSEILSLTKNIKEVFYLISRSNLSYYYQILIIINFFDSLSIGTLNGNLMLDLIENPSLNTVNTLSGVIEDNNLYESIIKILNKFLKFKVYNDLLDLLVILNGLSTLLVNTIHQGIKKMNSPEADFYIEISDYLSINSIKYYFFKIKFEKVKFIIMELHYLKANLCIPNQLLLERLNLSQCLTSQFSQIVLDRKYQKVLTSYLFLTIGVINSFSKIELDKNLIIIIGNLFDSQCFVLQIILKEELFCDTVFLKNMDGYRISLLEYTVRQIFFLRSKHQDLEILCENCIFKVVKLLSLFLEIQVNQFQQDHEENIRTIEKIRIKFETSICEVIIRSIQSTNCILDELFTNMEKIITHILNITQVEDNSNIDEIILNFLLSVSENLIRLSSQMKSIKNYKDSIRLLNLALKCLSNTFTVPWIATDEPICEIEKKLQKLKIIDNHINGLSEYSSSTPIRKYNDYLQEENNFVINDLLDFTKNPYERFQKNKSFEFENYESDKRKNVSFVSQNTNVKFESVFTPFTQKLRSKGLSQIQSQTIKRIQTSAISYITKSKSKFNKMNDREIITLSQKVKDSEVDFPIHILLFLIALDQTISSIQLQFSQEPNQASLDNILLLVEEKMYILFTLIDHRSYLFIFGDKVIELFPFIENINNLSKSNEHEKYTNNSDQIIKQYFFNLISSIVARFTKTKMLLINEFSADITTLYRYPEVKDERNHIIQIIWFNLELNYYLYYREVSNKYNQIFKKGILNGFCAEIVNVYKTINKFIDEKITERSVISSKLNFELYFNFKMEFINYYLWLLKSIFNIQNKYHDLLFNSREIYKNEINKILSELTLLVDKISLDYKFLYLSRINICNIYLLLFEDFNITFLNIKANISKNKNDKIHVNIEESLNLLYKYLGIHENYDNNFYKLLTLDYWKSVLGIKNNKIISNEQSLICLKQNIENKMLNEFDDIPIPISNKLKTSKQEENQLFSVECNYSESNVNTDSIIMFKTNDLINNQEISKKFCEIGLNELEILFYNTYEILEVIFLQDLDSILLKKIIGAILYLFSPCWTFILTLEASLVDIETISKNIYHSLNGLIEDLQLSSIKNNEKEILIMNIGLFISNILYYSAQSVDKEVYNSDQSILKWLNIANIYLDGLLFLIESKYLLSSDFLDEKISIPISVTETLLNLIVLKIENINTIDEVFRYLEIVNNIGIDEFIKENQSNVGLLIRILNKLSTFFMNANKPDISLFYLLESNKVAQIIISWVETCNINSLHWQHNILSACLSHNFQTYFVNLVLKSLFQLGEFWWKLGVIERSQSVYNKLVIFYKKWAVPYKKLILLYFYQLPILLNHLFSRSDPQLNLMYSTDNLKSFKQILYEDNVYSSIENPSNIDFLKEILDYIRIISDCKYLSYFEEEILLMALLFVLIYFSLNNSLPIIKEYFINNFSTIYQNKIYLLQETQQFEIIQILRRMINLLLKDDVSTSNLILELFSIDLAGHSKNEYFVFFLSNTINYSLLFISSKYTEIIGNYSIKKCPKETIENIAILESKFDLKKKFKSNIKKNSIEFTIKEICGIIISIKQILSIELSPIESQVVLIEPTKFNNSNNENKSSSNYLIGKKELTLLIDQLDKNESSTKNRLNLFKQIYIFVNIIFKHVILNEKMSYYLLNQLSVSIILDTIFLIKILCYPDNSWNAIFCCFIDSLTPISLSSGYSFSIVQSIRKIQREFDRFRVKDKYNSVFESKIQSNLINFFLKNKNHELSNWRWGEDISFKEVGDNISMVYIRFSTFFTNFTCKNSNRFKYSLLQVTKDLSFNNYINKITIASENKSRYNSSKLTLFHLVENISVNKLLGEFDDIQLMNTESIVGIDIDTNSSEQARKWWNRRISIESRLNKWLVKFSDQILKGWITKLLYGWRKELSIERNIKQVMEFIETNLMNVNQSLVDIVLFSLTNDVPQILALLESNNIVNFDITEICKKFKKIKFQSSKNKVDKFPVVIFLDKILICLPIESICDLKFQPITRGISRGVCKNNMDYLFNQLQKPGENNFHLLADSCNLYYCINPTGDLKETEKIITKFIKQKFGSRCSGISNSIPQTAFIMNNMIINQSNLYLFCGHQAGEKFIQGEAFERGIVNGNSNDRDHFQIPPSLLIGCSSSKIRSYGSNNIFFTPMHYLIGGSPFVLGALWDVTDQDIDRFTMSIFDNWVGSKLSLIESITLAKQECKLPLLNGSSCICFGYPI